MRNVLSLAQLSEVWSGILANNRKLWAGPARRVLLLKWTLCGALLSELWLCPRLWVTDRAFPTIPVFPGLPELPQPLCLCLAWLLVGAVLAVALLPRPGWAVLAVPILGGILVLFDITRLQPWFYEYMLMFVGLGLMEWGEPDSMRSKAVTAICGFILLATYCWSGLQKVNMSFAENIFPQLVQPLGLGHVKALWIAAPVSETLIGLLLVLPRTRVWGLAGAVAMHLFLLIILGPIGINYNPVVWPWNLALAILALELFYRNPEPIIRSAWSPRAGKAVMVLVAIMPILNFFGLWDDDLSACLYAGKARESLIYLSEDGAINVPQEYAPYVQRGKSGIGLDVSRWAMTELGVPPYPEVRVFKAVARSLVRKGVHAKDIRLVVIGRTGLFTSKSSYSEAPVN